MKLVTFQSFDALKFLVNNNYLECEQKFVNTKKYERSYSWVMGKMKEQLKDNSIKYPIWCWVKCYNGICPPKHKGKSIDGFDVKITFNKPKKDVFITDFRRYSFVLNNMYIPKDIVDKKRFDNIFNKDSIPKDLERKDKQYIDICNQTIKSFDRCITEDSDILQGCVKKINIDEVESIEIIPNDGYIYGSLNYVKSNGKRTDWIQDYYKRLK